MFEKLFGGFCGGDNCGCGCKPKNSSCDVLTILVIIYVLMNCGIFSCGIDICTILILLLFFCCCFCNKKKPCNPCC